MARPYAAVVGAVNMDIWGRSFDMLIPRDSNPGEIRFSPGGVGRNIAHNLRLLGVETEMLTALGGDVWAGQLEESCRAPLFVDPVSVTKAKKLRPFLHRIHTFKPNALEAAALTGETDPATAAVALVEAGVKRVFVSDGPGGMVCAHGPDVYHILCPATELVNATGGGDAAMAGLCRAFLDGRDIVSDARYALAAGSLAVECAGSINPALSDRAVRRRMAEK